MASRLTASEALAAPRRRLLHAAIQSNPGIAFRELCRLTGFAKGTARHHLSILVRSRCVVERRHGATLRFFESEHAGNWVEAVVRREPELALLLDWLRLKTHASQGQVLEAMRMHGWPRSTIQHRLTRLVSTGLATVRWQGRYRFYGPAPEPVPVEALAEAALAV